MFYTYLHLVLIYIFGRYSVLHIFNSLHSRRAKSHDKLEIKGNMPML